MHMSSMFSPDPGGCEVEGSADMSSSSSSSSVDSPLSLPSSDSFSSSGILLLWRRYRGIRFRNNYRGYPILITVVLSLSCVFLPVELRRCTVLADEHSQVGCPKFQRSCSEHWLGDQWELWPLQRKKNESMNTAGALLIDMFINGNTEQLYVSSKIQVTFQNYQLTSLSVV